MATRKERVVLELDDQFSSRMARVAAAASLANREINSLDRNSASSSRSTDRLSGSLSSLERDAHGAGDEMERLSERAVPTFNRNTAQTGNQIDKLSGRLALFAQTAAAVGPALAPIGAAAVPALAGLTTQMGFAGIAAGVTALAFNGVGDSLKALNAYDLDPSAANFEKLQTAMRGLGPAAREFVSYLHSIGPELSALRRSAQDGILPGAQAGIESLMTLAPRAEIVITRVANTVGRLLAEGGASLAGPKWRAFFDYLQSDAAPILTEMGHTLGSFVEGLGHMVVAFAPLTSSFSSGLDGMARSFAEWADGLASSNGFQSFIDYVQTSGPKVLALIGSLANMLVQVVTAAAPLGGPVLSALTAVANVIASLAESDLGTPIFTAAAAFAVLSRATAAWGAIGKSTVGQFISGQKTVQSTLQATESRLTTLGGRGATAVVASFREMTSASEALTLAEQRRNQVALRARDAQSAMIPAEGKRGAVSEYVAAQGQVVAASERVSAAERSKRAALRESAASIGKGAALMGGLAIATTGLADKTGLANTASLALMGTIAGPWGAAVGGGVGLALDFAKGNEAVGTAIDQANRAAASTDLSGMISSYQQLNDVAARQRSNENNFAKAAFTTDGLKNTVRNLTGWTSDADKAEAASQRTGLAIGNLKTSLVEAQAAVSGTHAPWVTYAEGTAGAARESASLQKTLDLTKRAFLAAGMSAAQANRFLQEGPNGSTWAAGIKIVRDYAKGVKQAYGSAGQSARAFAADVNNLLNGVFADRASFRDYEAAVDDFTASLKQNGKTLNEHTAAGRANSAALDNIAATSLKYSTTLKGIDKVEFMANARSQFTQAAEAAGLTARAAGQLATRLGLVPKNVSTEILLSGALTAKQKLTELAQLYHRQPRTVQTIVKQLGAEPTMAKVKQLAARYHLTPRQIITLLSVVDKASAKALSAQAAGQRFARLYSGALDAKDGASPKAKAARAAAIAFAKKYAAYLDAHDQSSSVVRTAIGVLQSFNGRHADAYITTHHVTVFSSKGPVGHHAGNPTINTGASQNGSFYEGHTRRFADGGVAADGSYVPRVSQFAKGGSNILWAEPETGEGEVYISLKPSMRERNLQLLGMAGDRLGADVTRRYANGGSPSILTTSARALTVAERELNRADQNRKRREHETEKAYKAHLHAVKGVANELSKTADKLKAQRDARKEYASTVAGAYVQDPFGGTLGGFNAQVGYESRNIRGAKADLATAKARGLNGALYQGLAASGNVGLIDQFAHLTRAQITREERLYGVRNRLDRGIGSQAANDVFNARIRTLTTQVQHLTAEMHRLRTGKHVGNVNVHMHGAKARNTEQLAKKTGRQVANAVMVARHA